MTDYPQNDLDDADRVIDRSIKALQLSGVGGDVIASTLMARSIFLWRQEGFTDDQICGEFASGIEIPLGRNK